MKSVMNYVNRLPVNTWNHLKVNEGILEFEIPENKSVYDNSINEGAIPENLILNSSDVAKVKQQLSFAMKPKENDISNLMKHHSNAHAFVHAMENEINKQPLTLSYYLDENNPYLFDENVICAEENSEITLLLNYQSKDNTPGVHGSLTSILAKKNAIVHVIQVQLLNDDSVHFDHIRGYVSEGASINITQIKLGANKNFVGSEIILANDHASYKNQVIYLGRKNQSIDMNYVANHLGKYSESDIIAKGCLTDESKKIFRATIDFKRGCSYASGAESEETLLLSPTVVNKSVPLILCQEDNVSGAHAANVGKIDENQLFYLMSRGLSKADAKQLIILSRLKSIYKEIPSESLKEQVEEFIKRSLNYENNQ